VDNIRDILNKLQYDRDKGLDRFNS
jgi:hypothetical protein